MKHNEELVIAAFLAVAANCSDADFPNKGDRPSGDGVSAMDGSAGDSSAGDGSAADGRADGHETDGGDPLRPSDGISPGDGTYDTPHRVGILYFVHHAPPTMAADTTDSTLTVEQVIRGQQQFSNIYGGNPDHARALAHLYHHRPEGGFYCLFETIFDATLPPAAVSHANSWSCASDVSAVATTHAEQLLAAGIDHVVLDLSNPTSVEETLAGAGPLLMALRPTEILFREWHALRQEGQDTPQIAAWAPVPTGATLWQRYLDLYNQYPELALTHEGDGPHLGKKIFFYVDSADSRQPDSALLAAIADNGGRQDVVAVPMWTHLNPNGSFGSSYRWAFMAPCMRQGTRTTSVIGDGVACDQLATPQSIIGSQITVSASYQYEGGYASLPFQSPGKLGGLTLKKQFHTAWQQTRDYLLVTGWNEHSSGHWLSAYTQTDVFAVGLEHDTTYGIKQFIDAYGTEYSRDLEPTVEYGRRYYDLLRSCVYRYRTGTCLTVGGEDCCDLSSPYVNVFSLTETWNLDFDERARVAVDSSEVQSALAGSWRQVCNRYPGTADFCIDIDEEKYHSGPFIAFDEPSDGRTGVYRCFNSQNTKHFLSVTPAVECAAGHLTGGDTPLFYVATAKNSETPRTLRRCYDQSHGSHFHAVGLPCPAGTEDAPAFGYVR